ncbi:MAG: helix-turn-helix domain-containing protein [Chloroflexota bacterium]|nr:helix-turn-helix domain-containing protein [Chloroflexota bacterium]
MNIRELREGQGLSQHALADRSGLSQATVSKIEAGLVCPNALTRRALSQVLGVAADEIEFKKKERAVR